MLQLAIRHIGDTMLPRKRPVRSVSLRWKPPCLNSNLLISHDLGLTVQDRFLWLAIAPRRTEYLYSTHDEAPTIQTR
jgi:hypothetical protein